MKDEVGCATRAISERVRNCPLRDDSDN